MEWNDFISWISLPLIAIVGFSIRQAQVAKKDASDVAKDLAEYKTEVAQNYTSITYLKDVKDDIMKYLEKIERKLDKYANGS